VVVRSAGIIIQADRFDRWTRRLEAAGLPLWNPPAVLRWNARKTYLQELAEAGVPVVPTRFVESPGGPDLDAVLHDAGWHEVVVKPVVSASAHETWRRRGRRKTGERFRQRRADAGHGPAVRRRLGGASGRSASSAAVQPREMKRPPGDWFSPITACPPADSAGLISRLPRRSGAGNRTLYARVDGCVVRGELHLMELELLEPALFLALHPDAPDRFAAALAAALAKPAA
jgi:hypothetical protein